MNEALTQLVDDTSSQALDSGFNRPSQNPSPSLQSNPSTGSRTVGKRASKQAGRPPTRRAPHAAGNPTMLLPVGDPTGPWANLAASDAVLFGPNDPRRHQLAGGRHSGSYGGIMSSAGRLLALPEYSSPDGMVCGAALPDPFYTGSGPSLRASGRTSNIFGFGAPGDLAVNLPVNPTAIPTFGMASAPPALGAINPFPPAEVGNLSFFPQQPPFGLDLPFIDQNTVDKMVNLDQTALPIREQLETMKPEAGETPLADLDQATDGNNTSTAAGHIVSESVNGSNGEQAAPKRLIFVNEYENLAGVRTPHSTDTSAPGSGQGNSSQVNAQNSGVAQQDFNSHQEGEVSGPANATADLYPFIVPVSYPTWSFDPAGYPVALHPVHPWFAGKDEVKFDDPELPHLPVDHRWPYTPAGRANIYLPRFCLERIHRVIEVPGSFVPVIGLLYPNAEFLIARCPPSTNPVHRFNGFAMGKAVLLDPANEHRKFAVCLRRRDW